MAVIADFRRGRGPWGAAVSLWTLLLLAFVLAACHPEPQGPTAEQLGELYFEAIKAGDFDAAAALYDEDVPREAVRRELRAMHEQFGGLEDYTMTDLVSYIAGGSRSYTLKYKTRYANHHASEGLLIQLGRDNRMRIKRNEFQAGSAR